MTDDENRDEAGTSEAQVETVDQEAMDQESSGDEAANEMAESPSTETADAADGDSSEEETASTEDSSALDPPLPTFDAANLPEIEADYGDDLVDELVRRALSPIEGEYPCGENESEAASVISQIETTTDSIHEALRNEFGDAVRGDNTLGFEISSVGREASDLVDRIVDCLEEKCKSSILASYLPHLMLIEYGLPGFRAGLDIFRELLERYEGHLFPRDQEKLQNYLRRGVYIGNDDKVTDNFKLFLYQPITEKNRLPYALLRNSKLRGANQDVDNKYAHDASGSTPAFYVKLVGDLEQLTAAANAANAVLKARFDDPLFEIVSFSFIESVERMTSIVNGLATDSCSGYPPVEAEADAEAPAAEGSGTVVVQQVAAGEIVTREQAIEMLGKIADFFHRTERHSPVSYRIRETIKWCKMDLPELLQELFCDDQSPLDDLSKRVGFRGMEQEDDDSD